jgi:hypothetical protein
MFARDDSGEVEPRKGNFIQKTGTFVQSRPMGLENEGQAFNFGIINHNSVKI